MIVRDALSQAVEALEQGGIEDARRNAEWMLEEVLQCRRVTLYTQPDRIVSPDEVARLNEMVRRRLQREPLQYILGYTEFFGLCIGVSPDVLIPRPETEQVVLRALALIESVDAPRVLDIGTGSGCISIAVKYKRPDADVYACDVSPEALSVARRNAERLDLPVTWVHADALSAGAGNRLPGGLDLLISNPPYIPLAEALTLEPEVVSHEPHQALFSGDDPLHFYRHIVALACDLLKSGGHLVFETHASYGEEVGELLCGAGYSGVHVGPDLSGLSRVAHGQWLPNRS